MGKLKPTNYSALYTLVGVFFFWGFIAASNGVFIPFCKSKFELSQFQSQLIDSAFYFAYYIGAFLLFIFSVAGKKDLLNSWGFKNGIVYGLMLSVVGAFLMFPALASNNFAFILGALFIIGLGFSLQQTAAQPFAISLGDESTGSNRLNLAGGINSFGTTIGPIIFALALLGTTKMDESLIKELSLSSVQWLYLIVGLAFLSAGILFKFSKRLPEMKLDSAIDSESKATAMISFITVILVIVISMIFYQNTGEGVNHESKMGLYLLLIGIAVLVIGLLSANKISAKNSMGWGAFKYPQLVLGMIAIFTYVGTEVTIQSNLGAYAKQLDFTTFLQTHIGTSYSDFKTLIADKKVDGYWTSMIPMLISLYWGSLMIGRWAGAVSAFNLSSKARKLALIIVPYIAFLVILTSNFIGGESLVNIKMILPYAAVILIQIFGFYLGQDKPAKTLMIFGLLGMTAMILGIYSTGAISIFAFVSGGLFCSVMWPVIFSLSLQGLGKYTSQGSAFLVMMILGGAFLPPLQGKIADLFDVSVSYWVPVAGFAYLTLFAILVKNILKKQNIDSEKAAI
ncbi:MAG: MFS transporter [Bacteroidetes bacterium CG2_30_33_31]|nr:MAG: MFS transporter [Bacteroidetes bacterium CG2_30_33_31]